MIRGRRRDGSGGSHCPCRECDGKCVPAADDIRPADDDDGFLTMTSHDGRP